MYSPVFWTAPSRYASDTSLPALQSSTTSANAYLRRNRFDQNTFPSAKVMFWERGDFLAPTRLNNAGARVRISPSWLNPEAQPYCTFVDGSCAKVKMSTVHAAAESTDDSLNQIYRPCFRWDLPRDLLPEQGGQSDDVFENGDNLKYGTGTKTKIFRQYFWGTRNGIRGRDTVR
jgi:hypothetical protein